MDDPIKSHPTRAEQLDILTTAITDIASPGDRVLDLGCGTGYVGRLLLDRGADLDFTGVDLKPESLDQARGNLAASPRPPTLIAGDLGKIDDLAIPDGPYAVILSCLTFHDLDDAGKRRVIDWAAGHLGPGGVFFLYDRLRLTEAGLFPIQQSVWRRIERLHGRGMRSADNFDAYVADLGTTNRPASLADYQTWFADAGLAGQLIHLHGNVALMAGTRT